MSQQPTVLAGYVMPHPPIIVPGVKADEHSAQKTVTAMRALADDLAIREPETVVLISPHAPLFSDFLYVYNEPVLQGDLTSFGTNRANLSFHQDQALRDRIVLECREIAVDAGALSSDQHKRLGLAQSLDHGAVVPLFFLARSHSFRLVVLSSSGLPLDAVLAIGTRIRSAARRLNRRIVIVASGDQSHKANKASPYGALAEGADYDRALVESLKRSDRRAVLEIDPHLRRQAAECGYRSLVMLLGALGENTFNSEVLSYEAPYGIGYLVARLQDAAGADCRPKTAADERGILPAEVAKRALQVYLQNPKGSEITEIIRLFDSQPLCREKAGVFVTLKQGDSLRGCIGTIFPQRDSLCAEIVYNAISAAREDPRFDPVGAEELPSLSVGVDILKPPEPVSDQAELNPEIFGVIVRQNKRIGVLLQQLEGITTVADQLEIACRKGSIQQNKPYTIERFRVERFTEQDPV